MDEVLLQMSEGMRLMHPSGNHAWADHVMEALLLHVSSCMRLHARGGLIGALESSHALSKLHFVADDVTWRRTISISVSRWLPWPIMMTRQRKKGDILNLHNDLFQRILR